MPPSGGAAARPLTERAGAWLEARRTALTLVTGCALLFTLSTAIRMWREGGGGGGGGADELGGAPPMRPPARFSGGASPASLLGQPLWFNVAAGAYISTFATLLAVLLSPVWVFWLNDARRARARRGRATELAASMRASREAQQQAMEAKSASAPPLWPPPSQRRPPAAAAAAAPALAHTAPLLPLHRTHFAGAEAARARREEEAAAAERRRAAREAAAKEATAKEAARRQGEATQLSSRQEALRAAVEQQAAAQAAVAARTAAARAAAQSSATRERQRLQALAADVGRLHEERVAKMREDSRAALSPSPSPSPAAAAPVLPPAEAARAAAVARAAAAGTSVPPPPAAGERAATLAADARRLHEERVAKMVADSRAALAAASPEPPSPEPARPSPAPAGSPAADAEVLAERRALRAALRESLAAEPREGDPEAVLVRVRLGDGAFVSRRFAPDASAGEAKAWIASLDRSPLWDLAEWELASVGTPRRVLAGDVSLGDASAGAGALLLYVQRQA